MLSPHNKVFFILIRTFCLILNFFSITYFDNREYELYRASQRLSSFLFEVVRYRDSKIKAEQHRESFAEFSEASFAAL